MPDPVNPGTLIEKGGIMDMPAENHFRLKPVDPSPECFITDKFTTRPTRP